MGAFNPNRIAFLCNFSKLLLTDGTTLDQLLFYFLVLLTQMMKLVVFIVNCSFKSLVFFVVDVYSHLHLLLRIYFVLLVVVYYLFLLAIWLLKLFLQLPYSIIKAVLLLLRMMLIFHQNHLYFLLKFTYFLFSSRIYLS